MKKTMDELVKEMLVSSACKVVIDDEPTILNPEDFYKVYKSHPEMCSIFGMNCKADIDAHIKKFFGQSLSMNDDD